uniref:Uncharacterized protein n=1 Tax=Trieres chinensis TaxID=1514140 RepID=A0A7S1YV63_TRICV|mmetsp:Transcript_1132/g.2420  ORF Transcript_1132/g.2420 Transcript_1132/m.2420 type:complete len:209 (-) Transcript_1132:238-864(-)
MTRPNHGVPPLIDCRPLLGCRTTPKQKHHPLLLVVHGPHDFVCEFLPPPLGVAVGLPPPDGQDGVQKQHSPFRPGIQAPVGGGVDPDVVDRLSEHVPQRGGEGDAPSDREGEAVTLTGTVVRVLTDYDDLDAVEGAQVEGGEGVVFGGVDGETLGSLGCDEVGEVREGFGRGEIGEGLFPAGVCDAPNEAVAGVLVSPGSLGTVLAGG